MTVKPFLYRVSERILELTEGQTQHATLMVPNKRAVVFVRKYLSEMSSTVLIEPEVLPIAEFVARVNPAPVADSLALARELFMEYRELVNHEETFDQFLPWGEMLLKDFDELDKYQIDAKHLFTVLSDHRDLIARFDYLDEEQRSYIDRFWRSLEPVTTEEQRSFNHIWAQLYPLYTRFRARLTECNRAYEGMKYREAAMHPAACFEPWKNKQFFIAGFHALNRCEEEIFAYARRELKARFFWDADAFYVEDKSREAGKMLREYMQRFPGELEPTDYFRQPKNIYVISTGGQTSQALALGNVLLSNPAFMEDSAVVLPDEALLFPVLTSLPASVDSINITMGYPVTHSQMFQWVLQFKDVTQYVRKRRESIRWNFYYLRTWYQHPFFKQLYPELEEMVKYLAENEGMYFQETDAWVDFPRELEGFFQLSDPRLTLSAMREFARRLLEQQEIPGGVMEREVVYQFYLLLNRWDTALSEGTLELGFDTFLRCLIQQSRQLRVPFTGEPLAGIQVMGLLETRNLDFSRVFLLGMNDKVMPAAPPSGSYIPYHLRKGFGLPTIEHHDSFYAYYFYRLIQAAGEVYLFYDGSEASESGEISRYVHQLVAETDWNIRFLSQKPTTTLTEEFTWNLPHDTEVERALQLYEAPQTRELSPTGIKQWLECKARFYFRYVKGWKADENLSEEVDGGLFGNLLHTAMFHFYEGCEGTVITRDWLEQQENRLERSWEQSVRTYFHIAEEKAIELEGERLLAARVIRRYLEVIWEIDRQEAPFEIVSLEKQLTSHFPVDIDGEVREIVIGGTIDRIDRKDGALRVMDYKTGTVKSFDLKSLEELWEEDSRNLKGEILQTFIYGLLVTEAYPGEIIYPRLIALKSYLKEGKSGFITLSGEAIRDFSQVQEEFAEGLWRELEKIWKPGGNFTMTQWVEKCRYCDFAHLCRRETGI